MQASSAVASAVSSAAFSKGPLLRNCIGALLINKASGLNSRDAYQKLVVEAIEADTETIAFTESCADTEHYNQPPFKKKKQKAKGAGHIGTLDPFATGALPVFFGMGTKLVPLFANLDYDKNYEATLKLGVKTKSGDLDGDVVSTDENYKSVTNESVVECGKSLVGQLVQKSNIYSAQKVEGKELYKYAHNNEIPPWFPERTVTIAECETELKDPQTVSMKVQCGSGTYIRTLGEQLAEKLGTCGHLTTLHRSRRGLFEVDEIPKEGSESVVVTQYTIGDLLDLLGIKVKKCVPQAFRRRLDEQLRSASSHMVEHLIGDSPPGFYCLQIGNHPVSICQKFDEKEFAAKIITTFPVPPSAFIFPTAEQIEKRRKFEENRARNATPPGSSGHDNWRRHDDE